MQGTGQDPLSTERFLQRNYKQFYVGDQYVLIHHNGLCIVGIAPHHPIVQSGKKIEKVNFNVSNHDYSVIQAVGKKKKGAPKVRQQTNLVQLNCVDGSKYVLKCHVNGSLIETNQNIVSNPELIEKWPTSRGYIGIIQCNQKERVRISQESKNANENSQETPTAISQADAEEAESDDLKRKREATSTLTDEQPFKKIKSSM